MPYLKLQTNINIEDKKQWMTETTAMLSDMLGKSSTYIMVVVEDNREMMFAASDEPLAFVELKSIGLPESEASGYSAKLCAHLEKTLRIAPNRVYIEFTDVKRSMFGWNGRTFG